MNLPAVLPIAEKALAREKINTANYMCTGAVYLGDNRIFGAQPGLGGDYKGLYTIIDSHKIKLPTWVVTYSLFADTRRLHRQRELRCRGGSRVDRVA